MQEEHNNTQKNDNDVSDEVVFDTEEDVEETPLNPLAAELAEEREKSADLLDRLQRLQAEFDNYRKRMDNHMLESRKFASEEILLKFLDIYDNFLRALEMDFEADPATAKKGIEAIQQQFDKTLVLEGVRPIESVGKVFDPYYQHAVNRINDPDKPDGIILVEYQRGYMLKEKVLRPAVVSVNHHESPPTNAEDDDKSETKSDENGE
ncbi:nucleotide exchange factor GrpE [Candidatus Thorarchaeota archaeon]|nr:MAG: nucleotide exchange factor GrpE [Candidatus Thorarchaeota archaeon]